ncbi:hypothetical protein LMIY3S_05309 [Labrys miyagiensis]
MLRSASRLAALAALLFLLLAVPATVSAQTPDTAVADLQKTLTQDGKALADVSQGLQNVKGDDADAAQALETLKATLDKTHDDLKGLEKSILAARDRNQANIDQLGPAPKPSDPPEAGDKAAARRNQQELNQKLTALLTDARQQIALANGLTGSFAAIPLQQSLAQDRKALADVGARLADIKDEDSDIPQKMQALRTNVDRARTDLVSLVSDVTQMREAAKASLDKLGPKPKPDEPPESKDVADERTVTQTRLDQLNALLADVQGQIKQADTHTNAIIVRPFKATVGVDSKALDVAESSMATLPAAVDQASQVLRDQRANVDTVRSDLVTLLSTLVPLRDQSQARFDKLPQPPKAGDAPESWDIASQRDKETSLLSALKSAVDSAQALSNRADDLTNSIVEHQRSLITGQLFNSDGNVFSKDFWIPGGGEKSVSDSLLGAVGKAIETTARAVSIFHARVNSTSIAILLLTIAAGYVVIQFLRFRILRWRARLPKKKKTSRRYVASLDGVLELVHTMLGLPCAVLVAVLAVRFAGLLPPDVVADFGSAFLRAAFIAVGLWALARAILAQEHPELRLLPLSDWAVRRIRRRMSWLALVLGISLLLDGFISALHAPPVLTSARAGITAGLIIAIIVSLLIRLRRAPPTLVDGQPLPPDEDINALDILRPMSWVAVFVMGVCLLLGYNILAVAVAVLPLMLLSLVAGTYLLTTLVDSALTDNLLNDADRRRAIAGAIGITSKNVSFAATLLSGVLRFLILIVALLSLGAPFGFYSGDMLPMVQRAYFGFQVGGMTVSPSSILSGILFFVGIWGVTRLIKGWMRNTLLPRTTFDAGLQNSIATIIGYVGFILAISLALAEIGVSLQNIAYVASALAVGIGFGLQAIVNNFVSGLILLAERPIRVGDIIAAGGEEGYVRRISVRATEIETFERATLIIPNSTLITGSVKNWVYGNTWSRLRIVLTLAYDSDIDAVRAAMLGAAEDDPRILPTPPPRVYLSKIDAGLEFHLECMIASMETQPAVRNDVLTRILKTFRAKGIRLLAQGAAAAAPVVVQFDEQLQSAAIARLLLDPPAASTPPPASASTAPPPATGS